MKKQYTLEMLPQPDDTSCGPTCLHAIYRYFQDSIPLSGVVEENSPLTGGGTLAVFLANHALRRGYDARIYTYNLHMFDPTWFNLGQDVIKEKLLAQMEHKHDPRLVEAARGYIDFLELGGELRFEDLTIGLIRSYLKRSLPILTGLSATYLYRNSRENPVSNTFDDIRGEPVGHFVVLSGYDKETRSVQVADPYGENPVWESHYYSVNIGRVLGAILLGVLTHDANLLIIQPENPKIIRRKRCLSLSWSMIRPTGRSNIEGIEPVEAQAYLTMPDMQLCDRPGSSTSAATTAIRPSATMFRCWQRRGATSRCRTSPPSRISNPRPSSDRLGRPGRPDPEEPGQISPRILS